MKKNSTSHFNLILKLVIFVQEIIFFSFGIKVLSEKSYLTLDMNTRCVQSGYILLFNFKIFIFNIKSLMVCHGLSWPFHSQFRNCINSIRPLIITCQCKICVVGWQLSGQHLIMHSFSLTNSRYLRLTWEMRVQITHSCHYSHSQVPHLPHTTN